MPYNYKDKVIYQGYTLHWKNLNLKFDIWFVFSNFIVSNLYI